TDLHGADRELTEPKLPLIVGHQIVGRVGAVGPGVDGLRPGDRVGVPWLAYVDGTCEQCRAGRENLCVNARFTGYTVDGGYAEQTVARADACLRIPERYSDVEAAPLLCAGLIGYRAYRFTGDGPRRDRRVRRHPHERHTEFSVRGPLAGAGPPFRGQSDPQRRDRVSSHRAAGASAHRDRGPAARRRERRARESPCGPCPRRRGTGGALMRATLAIMIIAAAAVLAVFLLRSTSPPSTSYSTSRSAWALPALSGRGTVRLTDFRGKPLVLDFYASWCTACQTELPEFLSVDKQLGGRVQFAA